MGAKNGLSHRRDGLNRKARDSGDEDSVSKILPCGLGAFMGGASCVIDVRGYIYFVGGKRASARFAPMRWDDG